MLKLEFVCVNFWSMPVYKDQKGNVWLDLNLGQGEPDLYRSSDNDYDGDPHYPIGEHEFITKYEED